MFKRASIVSRTLFAAKRCPREMWRPQDDLPACATQGLAMAMRGKIADVKTGQNRARLRILLLPPCFPHANPMPEKQKAPRRALLKQLRSLSQTGAGEEIRTLDPNLGKVMLYP